MDRAIASARGGAYSEAMLRYLVGAVLGGGLAAGSAVQAAAPIGRPEMAGATIALATDDGAAGVETVARCLADAGLRVAEPAEYLVHFSRAVRPRKMQVELEPKDAAAEGLRRRARSGRTVETAALTISDLSSGKVMLRLEAARKLRRGGRDSGLILTDLCGVIRRAMAPAVRQD